MKRFHKTQFLFDRFKRAAVHALHHRHKAAAVVDQLIKFSRWSHAAPSFTYCYLAADRGVQFRGTARAVVNELEALGFVTTQRVYQRIKERIHYVTRYWINHAKIAAYAAAHALRLTGSYSDRPRTKEAWDTARRLHAAQVNAAADAAELRRRANLDQQRGDALPPQEFAAAIAAIRAKLSARPA